MASRLILVADVTRRASGRCGAGRCGAGTVSGEGVDSDTESRGRPAPVSFMTRRLQSRMAVPFAQHATLSKLLNQESDRSTRDPL